jgi:hypothetical protein
MEKPINRAVSLSVSLWTLGPKPMQFRAGFGVIFGGRGAELLPAVLGDVTPVHPAAAAILSRQTKRRML